MFIIYNYAKVVLTMYIVKLWSLICTDICITK